MTLDFFYGWMFGTVCAALGFLILNMRWRRSDRNLQIKTERQWQEGDDYDT